MALFVRFWRNSSKYQRGTEGGGGAGQQVELMICRIEVEQYSLLGVLPNWNDLVMEKNKKASVWHESHLSKKQKWYWF